MTILTIWWLWQKLNTSNTYQEKNKNHEEKWLFDILNIDNQTKELLEYAKELCVTSDHAFKDFVSGETNTDDFAGRNNEAHNNFEKLFKEIYKDKILKTKEGDELQFEELKFESNSNLYTIIFSSKKEKSFDWSWKKYWFVSWWADMPIYQRDVRNYDKYVEGMNTQFNFEDESKKILEEMLSYNNNADLFNQYRSNSFNK